MFDRPFEWQPTKWRAAIDYSLLASRVTRVFDPLGTLSYLGSTVSTSRCEGRRARLLSFMDKKRIVTSAVVFCILAVLVYLQYRHWHSFDWGTFWAGHVTHQEGSGRAWDWLLSTSDTSCALVRWKIFLKPVRPKAKMIEMVSPTLIGFTGLALLGRAGESIRPYLIARRQNFPFSSQLAVWAVERIFDIGAFTVLIGVAIFLPSATTLHSASGIVCPVCEGGVLS